MQATHLRHLIVWPVAATMLLVCNGAFADDNDPAAIEQRLKSLESAPERKALVKEPAGQARNALKRVLDARAAGDASHAVELAALANDWVNLAANVLKAAELEKELAAQQAKLAELEQKRRRTETLLEATIAQRERTREELRRQSDAKVSRQAPGSTSAKDSNSSPKRGAGPSAGPGSSRQPKTAVSVKTTGPASTPAAKTSTAAKAPAGTTPSTKPQVKP